MAGVDDLQWRVRVVDAQEPLGRMSVAAAAFPADGQRAAVEAFAVRLALVCRQAANLHRGVLPQWYGVKGIGR